MITAVVLAAGASTRFGSPKQALLLEPIVRRIRPVVDDVVAVVGAHEVETTARIVHCPQWEHGPGASLRCGLAALGDEVEVAVVVLGDGPGIDPRAVQRVVAAWRDGAGDRVAATYGGVRLHPLLLARSVWDEIPDAGLRELPAVLVACDDLNAPGDVDFADDLHEGGRPEEQNDYRHGAR
ncbi:MAG TPA: NTP transferase domain-containing protein [Gaiellaceae bacterium]|nr:NTP transferase domain-containing protein [Gaiellaceae bacterium]